MKYKIIERDSFQVIGVKREISYKNGENLTEIPKLWTEVHADGTNDLLIKLNNGEIKGVLGVCVNKPDTEAQLMDYWIATEHKGIIPDGLLSLELPASKWGVFEVHGAMPEAIQNVWEQIYSEWFPSGHYTHAGTPNLEVYLEGDPWSPDYYSEIWIPLK
ncbi:GyrI-like domain-containing protein [Neobacillus drentensis]|uniref:GyrI-like domain-containing protein n=1 Tax=Neobacillus drentensis TaxID=220684 RepID=UPI002FFE47F0